MVDFMGMMKKAEELQRKMADMQDEAGRATVEGHSGGGLVTVTMSCKGELKALKIDPSLFKEDDVEVLEDLIVTAHNEAKQKAEASQKSSSRGKQFRVHQTPQRKKKAKHRKRNEGVCPGCGRVPALFRSHSASRAEVHG